MRNGIRKLLGVSLAGLVYILWTSGLCAQQGKEYMKPPADFFRPRNVSGVTIQPGDTIVISSFYSPELNRTVRVREDGMISLPLLQSVQAGGLTPAQLQQALVEDYAHEFTNPGVTVDVASPANSAVYVTGEVGIPGAKEIRGRMTVSMALASAQVLMKSAKPKSTFLIRSSGSGHYDVYKIDASFPSGSARDIEVAPGDVLFVPKKAIAKADDFIDLWVRQLLPATPTANTSLIFTPGNTATIASVSK